MYNLVLALYDYTAQCEGELTFKKGEYIEVTNKNIGSDAWWEGKTLSTGMTGQFPKAYVKEIEQQQQQQPPPVLFLFSFYFHFIFIFFNFSFSFFISHFLQELLEVLSFFLLFFDP